MTRNVLILCLLLACLTAASAQESEKYLKLRKRPKYRAGYVITNDSVRSKGLIKTNSFDEAQNFNSLIFITTDGKERLV